MNGNLNYFHTEVGHARGAFAVLSLDEFKPDVHRCYSSIEIQLEGLEPVSGVAPISKVKVPAKPGDDPTWSATINKSARLSWSTGGHFITLDYSYSAQAFDFYEFRIAFGPSLRITSSKPLTLAERWLEWIKPLRQLISLLTGAPRGLRYFLASTEGKDRRPQHDQVFGWDITHSPSNSVRATIDKTHSLLSLTEDNISLLDLLHSWQKYIADRHPLFETYGAMTTAADQHPRSRLLLLLQALEGSFGFENRIQHQESSEQYRNKRNAVMVRANDVMGEADLKFIEKNLRREALQGLDAALAKLLKRLPNEFSAELADTELIKGILEADTGGEKLPLHSALTRVRNTLSHGSGSFEPLHLEAVANILERAVRAEVIRFLGASEEAQRRAAGKPEQR